MNTVVGGCAMSMCGLASFYPGVVYQTTQYPELDGWSVAGNKLFYMPKVDEDTQGIKYTDVSTISMVRIPTQERAIIDYIQNLDRFGIDYLYDGLEEYGYLHKGDWSALEEMAEKYDLLDELHFHIKEAYETSSDGE